ncbi:MAG: SDR family oxidoreductase [Deltaproteobacteria bacterium]|nr:SDR family oxidoreductase [Deltaproteobacteria bacterium]
MKLSDLKVVVTGGASGMGRRFVERLLEGGARVAAWDMNEEGLAALQADHPGAALLAQRVDVSKEEQVAQAMGAAWEALGGLNALVNNAGIFRDSLLVKRDKATGEVQTMTLSQWQTVLDVDLTGPFLCTRELSRRLVEGGGETPAVIVNISSVSRAGNMGQANYSAAKAGLVADTVTWAKELARYQIRVAAIAPGFIETPILQGMRPEMVDKMVQQVPLRRLGGADEIFAGVRFIVECEYFTGRCLDIDGGLRL